MDNLRLPSPKVELANGVKGKGEAAWKYEENNGEKYWSLILKGQVSIPELVENAKVDLSLVRPDNVNRTGIEHGGISLELKRSSWIPLGTTGLYITGLAGDFYDGYGEPELSKACKLGKLPAGLKAQMLVYVQDESGGKLLDGELGIWAQFNALNFGIDGSADILEGQAEANVCAALSNGVFRSKASIELDATYYVTGKFQLDVWQRNGKRNIAGSAGADIGLKKGALLKAWLLKVPRKYKELGSVETKFGRFTNGKDGFTGGFRFWGETWGVGYIGSSFKVGGIGKYKLASPDAKYQEISTGPEGVLNLTVDLPVTSTGLENVSMILAGSQFYLGANHTVSVKAIGTDNKSFDLPADSIVTIAENDEEEDQGAMSLVIRPTAGVKTLKVVLNGVPAYSEYEVATYFGLKSPLIATDAVSASLGTNSLPKFSAKVTRYFDYRTAKDNYLQDYEPVVLYRRSYRYMPSGQIRTIALKVDHTGIGSSVDGVDGFEEEEMLDTPTPRWRALLPEDFESGKTRMEDLSCVTKPATNTLQFTDCQLQKVPMHNGIYEFAMGMKLRRYTPSTDPYEVGEQEADEELEVLDGEAYPFKPYKQSKPAVVGFEAALVKPRIEAKKVSNLQAVSSEWSKNWNEESESRMVMLNWVNPNKDVPDLNYKITYWPLITGLSSADMSTVKKELGQVVYIGNLDHYEFDVPGLNSFDRIDWNSLSSSRNVALKNLKNSLTATTYNVEVTPVRQSRVESAIYPGQISTTFQEIKDSKGQSLMVPTQVILGQNKAENSKNKIKSITIKDATLENGVPVVKVPLNKTGKVELEIALTDNRFTEGNSDAYAEILTKITRYAGTQTRTEKLWNYPRVSAMQEQIVLGTSDKASATLHIQVPQSYKSCRDYYKPHPMFKKNSMGEYEFDTDGNPALLKVQDTLDQVLPSGFWINNGIVYQPDECRFGNRSMDYDMQARPQMGRYEFDLAVLNRAGRQSPVAPSASGTTAANQKVIVEITPPALRIANLQPGYLVSGRNQRIYFEMDATRFGYEESSLKRKVEFLKKNADGSFTHVWETDVPYANAKPRLREGQTELPRLVAPKTVSLSLATATALASYFNDGDTVWLRVATKHSEQETWGYGNVEPMVYIFAPKSFECPSPDAIPNLDSKYLPHVMMGLGPDSSHFSEEGVFHLSENFVDRGRFANLTLKDDQDVSVDLINKVNADIVFNEEGIYYKLKDPSLLKANRKYTITLKKVIDEEAVDGKDSLESGCTGKVLGSGTYVPANPKLLPKPVSILVTKDPALNRARWKIQSSLRGTTRYYSAVGVGSSIRARKLAVRTPKDVLFPLYQSAKVYALASLLPGSNFVSYIDSAFIMVQPKASLVNGTGGMVSLSGNPSPVNALVGEKLYLDLTDASGSPWSLSEGVQATVRCRETEKGPDFDCLNGFLVTPNATGKLWVDIRFLYMWQGFPRTEKAETILLQYKVTSNASMGAGLDFAASACQSLVGMTGKVYKYPLLVKLDANSGLSNAEWQSLSNGFVFRDGQGKVLETDLEKLDPGAKAMVAWVRIPEFDVSNCPIVKLFPYSSVPLEGNSEVYSTAMAGVWHLHNNPLQAANLADYALTASGWQMDQNGLMGASLVRNAYDNGSSILLPAGTHTEEDQGFGFSAWIEATADQIPASGWTIVQTHAEGISLHVNSDSSITVQLGENSWTSTPGVFTRGRWTHVSLSIDAVDGKMELRIDGQLLRLLGFSGRVGRSDIRMALGAGSESSAMLIGPWSGATVRVDELRLFRSGIPAIWNRLDYRTQRQYLVDQHLAAAQAARPSQTLVVDGNCGQVDILTGSRTGDPLFRDRGYTIGSLPQIMKGGTWLQLGNALAKSEYSAQACFAVRQNADLYVMLETSDTKPAWLKGAELLREGISLDLQERLEASLVPVSTGNPEELSVNRSTSTTSMKRSLKAYKLEVGQGTMRIPARGAEMNYGLLLQPNSNPSCAKVTGERLSFQRGIIPGMPAFQDGSPVVESVTESMQASIMLQHAMSASATVLADVSVCRSSELFVMVEERYAELLANSDYDLTSDAIRLFDPATEQSSKFLVFRKMVEAGTLAVKEIESIPGNMWLAAIRIPQNEQPDGKSDGVEIDSDGASSDTDPNAGFKDPKLQELTKATLQETSDAEYITLTFNGPVRVFVAHGPEMVAVANKLNDFYWLRQGSLVWEESAGQPLAIWMKEYWNDAENIVVIPTPRLDGILVNKRFTVFFERLEPRSVGYQVGNVRVASIPADATKSLNFTLSGADLRALSGKTESASWRMNLLGSHVRTTYQMRSVLSVGAQQSKLVVLENGQEVYVGNTVRLADLGLESLDDSQVSIGVSDLSAHGYVQLTVSNSGNKAVTESFWIQLYDDMNQDYTYSVSVDHSLGGVVVGDLGAGETRVLQIPVNGQLAYPERAIFAIADPGQQITEVGRTNNRTYIPATCKFLGVDHEASSSDPVPGIAEGKNASMLRVWDTDGNGVVNAKDRTSAVWYESGAWIIASSTTGNVLARIDGSQNKRIVDLDHDGQPEWIFGQQIRSSKNEILWSTAQAQTGTQFGFDLNGNGYRERILKDGSCIQILDGFTSQVLHQDGLCGASAAGMDLTSIQPTVPETCADLSLSGVQLAEGMPEGEIWWKARVANSSKQIVIPAGTLLFVTSQGQSRNVVLTKTLQPGEYSDMLVQGYSLHNDQLHLELSASLGGWIQEKDLMNNRFSVNRGNE